MRPLPEYPPYQVASPPYGVLWLSVSLIVVVFSGIGALILQPVGNVVGIVSCGSAIVMVMLWMLRLLYYRLSVHYAQYYYRLVSQYQQEWWTEHQLHFTLSDVVLLGPSGSTNTHWWRLLKHEQRPAEVKNEANGKALRVARTLVEPAHEREVQLAKMLVLQWKEQRLHAGLPDLRCCYWQGSRRAWQAFCAQMQAAFPTVGLPAEPRLWRGEQSLAEFAAISDTLASNEAILVAGCHSLMASFYSVLPAGESAALWLVGKGGSVCLTRGEVYDVTDKETLSETCSRAERQIGLEEAPDACIMFAQPTLSGCGWNITRHRQDAYWGNCGEMEMLIVIALAAISAEYFRRPCSWIARDPQHTLALGIVKPGGEEN